MVTISDRCDTTSAAYRGRKEQMNFRYAELSKMFLPVAGEGTLQDALKASIENLNSEKVAQDDDRLVNLIRQFYLEPASVSPYNLTNDKRQDYSQGGQSAYVDALLDHAVCTFSFPINSF